MGKIENVPELKLTHLFTLGAKFIFAPKLVCPIVKLSIN
jgi:hypothetical protein